ncbi:hypothetical protein TSH7_27090 [Azospirillum sp. TSH7]|jgi:DNA-binding GntR family transcriptional regulator|uniref:GntR family transcriptional regulator n=1 Tax=unclassified Azospirillum TaxID=2630922 RepID=UPI000D60855E|nr:MULTISPECIES: GntR family transcriptional regulator [unclassified Azospirillum]PWC57106.1 hypothetical protein TSH7_27090 [Azospirillum sp. TSH7]PWC63454.1 hypothetical protein TSH20_19790 [Azospirillum sp. TSH20]
MGDEIKVDQEAASIAETAYLRIEEMIVTRALPPGSMISENRLAEELGCGRTPIREALQRLKLEGFIEIHPRRGALVTPVDVMKQLELLEVRLPLELLMSRLAIRRATKAERSEMLRLAAVIRQAAATGNRSLYLTTNRAIHEIRTAAAHNGMLAQTARGVLALSRRFWYAYIEDTDSFTEAADLHAKILTAIAESSEERAVEATQGFIDFLDRLTRRALSRDF